MAIMFRCINCNAKIKVPDDKAGKSGKCPKCSTVVSVPIKTESEFHNLSDGDTKIIKRDKPVLTKEQQNLRRSTSKIRHEFDQTELLHLPESLAEEVLASKKTKTRKFRETLSQFGEDDDLLLLDDDSAEVVDDSTYFVSPDEIETEIPDDYFPDVVEETPVDKVVTSIIKPNDKTKDVKTEKLIVKPSVSKSVDKQKKKTVIQRKSRLSEFKHKKKHHKPKQKADDSVKKSGSGFFWVFFGLILALAHTIAAFILGAWFMLERVEKGSSPVTPAFEIMKFDERLKDIDQKIKPANVKISDSDEQDDSDKN